MLGSFSYMMPGSVNHRTPDMFFRSGPGRVSHMVLGKVGSRVGSSGNGMVCCLCSSLWMVGLGPLAVRVGKGYRLRVGPFTIRVGKGY